MAAADPTHPPALFIMGPTASGKTDLAVRLVERLPCEIISVDSAMVYRGMDIGTAKPDAATLARAPHRLIDLCEPNESYSAARFRDDALRAMAQISRSGKIPLLVGGTMMYFKTLQHGLSDLPSADPEIRANLEAQAIGEGGWQALHRRLQAVDPRAAMRIHPNDPQRIQRALEVYELTGRPLSELQRRDHRSKLPYRVVKLAWAPEQRAVLHRRIAKRFEEMLSMGLEAEVRQLRDRYALNMSQPSMRCVGYRQVLMYLQGQCSREQMRERGIVATRQLAKRQLTWLRADAEVEWLPDDPGVLLNKTLNILRDRFGRFLDRD